MNLREQGERAKAASRILACSPDTARAGAIESIALALRAGTDEVLAANRRDLEAARAAGCREAFLDRLALSVERIGSIAEAAREVARLPDPVGMVDGGKTLQSGVRMMRMRVPFGVVGMIYEARPNVTVDAAALCLRSGNACLLRGSKEALESNRALTALMRRAVEECGLPADSVQLVEDVTRQGAREMMTMRGALDLLIPRGGAGLIRSVVENATVPVIETGAGVCHTYIDSAADLEMAVRILDNAKTSRPSVCNACETALVHAAVAERFLPMAKAALDRSGVQWRGCVRTRELLPGIALAEQEDFATEHNDYILNCRVVDSMDEALEHIRRFSTGHSECIVTESYANALTFTAQVDAAAVYVNASTRFTDGGEFGLGAEIGISTQKLHVRGPMGLRHLTSEKYVLFGTGQIR